MYPHRIRLRGPWDCEPLRTDGLDGLPTPFRMAMPTPWGAGGLGDFAGRVRFRRRFGSPTRIDAHETVWLTFAGITGRAELRLNDRPLSPVPDGPCAFEVTALLAARNELVVEIEGADGQCGLWGETALEVRCRAWLQGLRAERMADPPRVAVAGIVAGRCDGPLELYLLMAGRTVAYARAEAGDQRFELVSDPLDEALTAIGEVRIDLVQGGSIWYSATMLI